MGCSIQGQNCVLEAFAYSCSQWLENGNHYCNNILPMCIEIELSDLLRSPFNDVCIQMNRIIFLTTCLVLGCTWVKILHIRLLALDGRFLVIGVLDWKYKIPSFEVEIRKVMKSNLWGISPSLHPKIKDPLIEFPYVCAQHKIISLAIKINTRRASENKQLKMHLNSTFFGGPSMRRNNKNYFVILWLSPFHFFRLNPTLQYALCKTRILWVV